ncbi:MAG: 2,3-bisphosphoglycerate-independent phosphoglycerate mutase [Candidatus Izimaplasma sp.]|nr:2,3-bisphosphoglycerate-independent phosphoglycerate mutase [Candidatus Izimaplasma bacterium]
MKKPVALIILDGFGLESPGKGNAVSLADTPNYDTYMKKYPNSSLKASGTAVGLPEGQMGNSEVGHLNLGAGRIVYQSLTRINKSIEDGDFFENEAYLKATKNVKEKDSKLHIMGLLSDGGVHSHIEHFKALLKLAKKDNVEETYVHAFLDGRDTPPNSGVKYVKELEAFMADINYGKIASVGGRYYGMDRDKNWERTQKHYDILTQAKGPSASSAVAGIEASYDDEVFDEFVIPFNVIEDGVVENNDSVIFANFRPDRAIQMATALSNPEAAEIDASNGPTDLMFICTMSYSKTVKGDIAFGLTRYENMYGDVISKNGLKQLRIAETEKYAHVTFFFDGGEDKEIDGSTRVLVKSPGVATYDLKPEMSAYEVTEKVLEELEKDIHDTIILNFANCDMVGHTGIIPAAIKAVETVDECMGKVVEKILEKGGVALVTADHGNAEKMLEPDGSAFTAHTTSNVPLFITDTTIKIREGGILADLTPTMLEYLEVDQPEEMTGKSLIKK